MAEGVSEILEKLKLTSKEEEVIDIADDRRISEIESCVLSLVDKFLTCKPYNKRVALSTLRKVWGLDSELQIVEVGVNLFQFKFKTEFQMARILKDGPWSFDNQEMATRDVATNIDGQIGTVEDVEKRRSNDSQSLFMRVRVSVSVSKPLIRGFFVSDFEVGGQQRTTSSAEGAVQREVEDTGELAAQNRAVQREAGGSSKLAAQYNSELHVILPVFPENIPREDTGSRDEESDQRVSHGAWVEADFEKVLEKIDATIEGQELLSLTQVR
uniref:DUF4283 domain-containing protein n=1 Tax=Quercus lobata TaxID=97700 RepID=A0A7N2M0K3_QUELO